MSISQSPGVYVCFGKRPLTSSVLERGRTTGASVYICIPSHEAVLILASECLHRLIGPVLARPMASMRALPSHKSRTAGKDSDKDVLRYNKLLMWLSRVL